MNSKPRRVDGLDVNSVSDGYVIYRQSSERVHYLNVTGAFIFELCDGGTPVESMPELVREAFGLSQAPAREVESCLAELFDQRLIR